MSKSNSFKPSVRCKLKHKPGRAQSSAAERGPVVVGGHQGLDALDGALMNFESAQVLQVEVNLLNVGPVELDSDGDVIWTG